MADCTVLALDFSGNFVSSSKFLAYGTYNCTNTGSAPVFGSGYVAIDNTYNINLQVATQYWVCSLSASTLSGSCKIISNNSLLGTSAISRR